MTMKKAWALGLVMAALALGGCQNDRTGEPGGGSPNTPSAPGGTGGSSGSPPPGGSGGSGQ